MKIFINKLLGRNKDSIEDYLTQDRKIELEFDKSFLALTKILNQANLNYSDKFPCAIDIITSNLEYKVYSFEMSNGLNMKISISAQKDHMVSKLVILDNKENYNQILFISKGLFLESANSTQVMKNFTLEFYVADSENENVSRSIKFSKQEAVKIIKDLNITSFIKEQKNQIQIQYDLLNTENLREVSKQIELREKEEQKNSSNKIGSIFARIEELRQQNQEIKLKAKM